MKPRSAAIVGSATFVIVSSTRSMNCATHARRRISPGRAMRSAADPEGRAGRVWRSSGASALFYEWRSSTLVEDVGEAVNREGRTPARRGPPADRRGRAGGGHAPLGRAGRARPARLGDVLLRQPRRARVRARGPDGRPERAAGRRDRRAAGRGLRPRLRRAQHRHLDGRQSRAAPRQARARAGRGARPAAARADDRRRADLLAHVRAARGRGRLGGPRARRPRHRGDGRRPPARPPRPSGPDARAAGGGRRQDHRAAARLRWCCARFGCGAARARHRPGTGLAE